jgi:hypothetical protein
MCLRACVVSGVFGCGQMRVLERTLTPPPSRQVMESRHANIVKLTDFEIELAVKFKLSVENPDPSESFHHGNLHELFRNVTTDTVARRLVYSVLNRCIKDIKPKLGIKLTNFELITIFLMKFVHDGGDNNHHNMQRHRDGDVTPVFVSIIIPLTTCGVEHDGGTLMIADTRLGHLESRTVGHASDSIMRAFRFVPKLGFGCLLFDEVEHCVRRIKWGYRLSLVAMFKYNKS